MLIEYTEVAVKQPVSLFRSQ